MGQVIYRYQFSGGKLLAPNGTVLLVAQQGERPLPTIWVKHEPVGPLAEYYLLGTGGTVEPGAQHVGSAVCGPHVWHVFRAIAPSP